MSEYDFFAEGYSLSPFVEAHGLELFLFGFGPGGGFCLFGFDPLRVHLVVDFEGGGGEDFEERLSVVGDVHEVGGRENV